MRTNEEWLHEEKLERPVFLLARSFTKAFDDAPCEPLGKEMFLHREMPFHLQHCTIPFKVSGEPDFTVYANNYKSAPVFLPSCPTELFLNTQPLVKEVLSSTIRTNPTPRKLRHCVKCKSEEKKKKQ